MLCKGVSFHDAGKHCRKRNSGSARRLPLSHACVHNGRTIGDRAGWDGDMVDLVLGAGQAFQAATEWDSRRPVLEADDSPALETCALPAPALPRQGAMRDEARMLAGHAGLPQDDNFVLALIAEAAPHVRAMAGRLDRDHAFSDEI